MLFVFRPEHMVGLASGTLQQVVSASGVPLAIVRNAATGQMVGHAVGVAAGADPLLTAPQLVLGAVQMFQAHMGFQETYRRLDVIKGGLQSLQNSVGVLQTTTAVIGIGTVAGVALSAVNLHQILKLKQDVKQLRIEVKDGFIDLKKALKDQEAEIIQRIEQVATDVEFKHHRAILAQAYGLFAKAIARFQLAMVSPDVNFRNGEINGSRDMLFKALADYDNPHLLEGTCAAGQLRRQECVWAIDQAITTTYQLQCQYDIADKRLSDLQTKMRQDTLTVIDSCASQSELDFIYPEISRLQEHDLPMLESWQHHIDFVQNLPADDLQMLLSAEYNNQEISATTSTGEHSSALEKPSEQIRYEELKQKSHYQSLQEQLRFLINPDLRRAYEAYISQQAITSNYKALAPSNWQEIPDLTVANLYCYFQEVNKSQQ